MSKAGIVEDVHSRIENRFADTLRFLLKEHGKKQKDLAGYLGIRPQAVSLYCTGNTYPDIHTLISIAAFFDVDIGYLITGQKAEHKEIISETGLTSSAIEMLKKAQQEDLKRDERDEHVMPAVNRLLSDNSFYHSLKLALNRLSIIRAFFRKLESHQDEFFAMLLKEFTNNDLKTASDNALTGYLALRAMRGHLDYAKGYISQLLNIIMTQSDKQMIKKIDEMIAEVDREIETGHAER